MLSIVSFALTRWINGKGGVPRLAARSRPSVPPITATDIRPDASGPSTFPGLDIALVLPCYNGGAMIGAVVRDFRAALIATAGLVPDSLGRSRVAQKRILYLSIPSLKRPGPAVTETATANRAVLRDLLRRAG
jgi:hypothetical protein